MRRLTGQGDELGGPCKTPEKSGNDFPGAVVVPDLQGGRDAVAEMLMVEKAWKTAWKETTWLAGAGALAELKGEVH